MGFTHLKSEAWAAFLLKTPEESDSPAFSFLGCCPCHDLFLHGQGQLCSIFNCLHGHVSFSSSDCPPIAYIENLVITLAPLHSPGLDPFYFKIINVTMPLKFPLPFKVIR